MLSTAWTSTCSSPCSTPRQSAPKCIMGLVNVCSATLVLAASSAFPHVVAGARTNITRSTSVVLPQGRINGFVDDSRNSVFLGIPFAATTGGENRCVDHCDIPLEITNPSEGGGHLKMSRSRIQHLTRLPTGQHALRLSPERPLPSRERTV